MALSFLQIWLLGCFANHAFSSQINRKKEYDIVTPDGCVSSCEQQLNGICAKKVKVGKLNCCKKCECKKSDEHTFYQRNSTQACVTNPNQGDGCKYYLGRYLKDIFSVKLDRSKDTELGKMLHREAKLFSFRCIVKNAQYWNLLDWKKFDSRKSFQIYQKTEHYVRIKKEDAASLSGYLVKLSIECANSGNKKDSCIIFKILGQRKYMADVVTRVKTTESPATPLPTLSSSTPPITQVPVSKNNILIFVIIGVSLAILLIVLAVAICWIWKKRRKSHKGRHGETVLLRNGEDPNYQNNDRFSTRHSNEINNSTNNLTYLQAIDAGVGINRATDFGRDRKDPTYDYPDVNRYSKRDNYQVQQGGSTSGEKPIYAEPENIVKPRSDTEVVGVPGYQPPRGPFSDDTKSTYSSLDVTSVGDGSVYQSLLGTDEREKASKPPMPQYAIVEPEESGEITI